MGNRRKLRDYFEGSWNETRSAGLAGGEGGIRTHETVARLHAFQACAFDHSATSPAQAREPSRRARPVKLQQRLRPMTAPSVDFPRPTLAKRRLKDQV